MKKSGALSFLLFGWYHLLSLIVGQCRTVCSRESVTDGRRVTWGRDQAMFSSEHLFPYNGTVAVTRVTRVLRSILFVL